METFITVEFWIEVYQKLIVWLKSEGISLLLVTIICWTAFRLNRFFFKKFKRILINKATKDDPAGALEIEKRVNTLVGILKNMVQTIIWIVLIVNILKKMQIDIAPILASAGIMGLAIGFGAQELVRDIISGFFLLLENQVRTGDVAIINQTPGLVEKIELRTITLRDTEGVVHIFQNGKINTLSNMTKEWSAINFNIGVAYKEDITRVMNIMKAVGDEMYDDSQFKEKILEPMDVLGLEQFADSALVIRARFKTVPIEQWAVGREYRKRLKVAFDREGIEIPFPHTTLTWSEQNPPLKVSDKNN
jgi:small conductance mechanosensitive channel